MCGLNSTVIQVNTEAYVLTHWILNKLWGSYHYFPHFWGGNQGRKKSFNLFKVLKSVTGEWCVGPESTVHKSSLLWGAPNYNTLHNHTVATDATASQSAQENPSFACLFFFVVVVFVFETKSHSSSDWPWHPLKAVIISISHQTWPTFPF